MRNHQPRTKRLDAGKILFFIAEDGSSAGFYDALIHDTYKQPITAGEVRERSHGIWRVEWSVENARTSNDVSSDLNYSPLVNMKTGKVSIRGILRVYDNHISGEGKCGVLK